MIKFTKRSYSEIKELFNDFICRKNYFCNCFTLIEGNCDYFIDEHKTLFIIRKKETDFYRIYCIAYTEEVFCSMLENLDKNHVINIPSKKSIDEFDALFTHYNYKQIAKYKRYRNVSFKSRGKTKCDYASLNDIDAIYKLLYENFSPITGYLPSYDDLHSMINKSEIFINRDKETDEVIGIIGCQIEKSQCYLPFWIDKGGQGLLLLFSVFNKMVESGIKRIYFWINSENTDTIKLHELLGAKFDGLTDYIYKK